MRRLSFLVLLLAAAPLSVAAAQKTSPAQTRDSDHDGVPDTRDRCPGTPVGVPVDANGCPRTGDAGAAPPSAVVLPPSAMPQVPSRMPAEAAVPDETDHTRVGIGIARTAQGSVLTVPLRLAGGIMIEPEIGYQHASATFESPGTTTKFSQGELRLGIGVTGQLARIGAMRIVAGPRAGIIRMSTTDDSASPPTTTSTSWYVEAAAGGEYLLGTRASLGGEATLGFQRFTTDTGGGATVKEHDFLLGARFALRWYFR